MRVVDITAGKSRKDFVVGLLGIQKDLAGCISSLPINLRKTAEFEILLDVYLSIGAIVQHLLSCDPDAYLDVSVNLPSLNYFPDDLDIQLMLDTKIVSALTVYSDLSDGIAFIPDVIFNGASNLINIALSEEFQLNFQVGTASIATAASAIISMCLDCTVSNPVIWHGVDNVELYLGMGLGITHSAQQYIDSVTSGVGLDISIAYVSRMVAVVSDYYGKKVADLNGKKLSELYYIEQR